MKRLWACLFFVMVSGCDGSDLTCMDDATCATKCQEHCGREIPEAACNDPGGDGDKPRTCYCGTMCSVGDD